MPKIRKSGKKRTSYSCSLCIITIIFFTIIPSVYLEEGTTYNHVLGVLSFLWWFSFFAWLGWSISETIYNRTKIKSPMKAKNYIALLFVSVYIIFMILLFITNITSLIGIGLIGITGLIFWCGLFISDFIELRKKKGIWQDRVNIFGFSVVMFHFLIEFILPSFGAFFTIIINCLYLILFIIWLSWLIFDLGLKKKRREIQISEMPIKAISKIKYCPVCGQDIKDSTQFCENCGIDLSK